jgi:hypothetical protein
MGREHSAAVFPLYYQRRHSAAPPAAACRLTDVRAQTLLRILDIERAFGREGQGAIDPNAAQVRGRANCWEPMILQFVQPRALGRKASDEFAVRLCRTHHRAAHGAGDERAWRNSAGMDSVKVARKL